MPGTDANILSKEYSGFRARSGDTDRHLFPAGKILEKPLGKYLGFQLLGWSAT